MKDYLHEIPKETLTIENIKKDIKEAYKMNIIPALLLLFSSWILYICAKEFWDETKIMAIFVGAAGVAAIVGSVVIILSPLIGRKITSKKLVIVDDWLIDIRKRMPIRRNERPYYEFSFAKGSKYKIFSDDYGDTNYKWSKMYNMSNQGIYNYSQVDDDFYLVFSNEKKNNLLLIYNKKLFELKDD